MPDADGDRARVEIDIRTDAPAWEGAAAAASLVAVRAAAEAALADLAPGPGTWELSILLTDDEAIAALNRDWRGKEGPTNVLSFPSDDDAPAADGPPALLGDVIVAHATLVREAEAAGIPFADHLRHLVVHGVLHLLGYDHENDVEAEEMESRETEILAGLGVPDPYAGSDPMTRGAA
jgi:probable rRNA maturation factor